MKRSSGNDRSANGKLTVAAVLLFGRNPQRLLTQAMVRCARFKGTTEVHFLDMKVIQGSIIEQVEETLAFVKRNIRMAAEIKGLHREEKWEYPLEGLREAVVNAICHRDYASSANVQIRKCSANALQHDPMVTRLALPMTRL